MTVSIARSHDHAKASARHENGKRGKGNEFIRKSHGNITTVALESRMS